MISVFYFGRISLADKLREKFLVYAKSDPGFVVTVVGGYFACLVSMRRAQMTSRRQRKHRAAASKQLQRFKALVKSRGLNVLNRFYVLKAEFSATWPGRKHFRDIRLEFDRAISTSTRSGFVQDAALASELSGRFAERTKHYDWARHYYTSAYRLYKCWGAHAKAAQMMEDYGDDYISESRGPWGDNQSLRASQAPLFESCQEMHESVDLDAVILSQRSHWSDENSGNRAG